MHVGERNGVTPTDRQTDRHLTSCSYSISATCYKNIIALRAKILARVFMDKCLID